MASETRSGPGAGQGALSGLDRVRRVARTDREARFTALLAGDALSDYDVGWVNRALDGPNAAATALASLQRLANLAPRVLLPSHGPTLTDPKAAFATAVRRAQRLVDDPPRWCGTPHGGSSRSR